MLDGETGVKGQRVQYENDEMRSLQTAREEGMESWQ